MKYFFRSITIFTICLFINVAVSKASIKGMQTLELDFTKPEEIEKKASWSGKQYFDIAESGLGFEGADNMSRDLSMETTELWSPTGKPVVPLQITPCINT